MKKLIYDTNKSVTIPETVDELTGNQLIAIAEILCTEHDKFNASLMALKVLSNLSYLQLIYLGAEAELRCIEHVQFVFDDFRLTKQLLPKYKPPSLFPLFESGALHGPKSDLENFTLSEFFFSEIFYSEFVNNKADQEMADESLNQLIAVMYRPAKKKYNTTLDTDGDIRIAFNANTISYYANKIRRWPRGARHAILMFYDGCREKIKLNNPNIFGEGGGEDNHTGMYGLMRGLAGTKFGEMEKVEKMYLHTALLEINILIDEEARMDSQLKK